MVSVVVCPASMQTECLTDTSHEIQTRGKQIVRETCPVWPHHRRIVASALHSRPCVSSATAVRFVCIYAVYVECVYLTRPLEARRAPGLPKEFRIAAPPPLYPLDPSSYVADDNRPRACALWQGQAPFGYERVPHVLRVCNGLLISSQSR